MFIIVIIMKPSLAQLERMVSKPTWKSILLNLIETNSIDPWDINIVELADAFVEKIKDYDLDMLSYSNIILAAAILLKHKSRYLESIYMQPEPLEYGDEPLQYEPLDVPELSFVERVAPKKPITLSELVQEVERVIEYEKERILRLTKKQPEPLELKIDQFDIEKEMNTLYGSLRDEDLFSTLVSDLNPEDKVKIFLMLLHLEQEEKVELNQEVLYGDIKIRKI